MQHCQDLSTENKELKKEIKVLRFKVIRLTNKLANNQKQWVDTLQEIQLHASKDHLVSDCGACSDFVLGWGGKSIPNCGLYKTLQLFSFVLFIFDGYSMYISEKAVNPWFSNNIQFLFPFSTNYRNYSII